jgi:hypothetical protein
MTSRPLNYRVVTRRKSDYAATCFRTTSSASARPQHPAPPAKPASCRFKSAVLYVPHLNAVAAPALNYNNNVYHVDLEALRHAEADRAFQAVKSMEKHRVQNGKKNQKHHEYEQYEYHKGHSGSQTQRGSGQRQRQQQPSASKSQSIEERTIRGYDRRMIDDVLGNGPTATQGSPERGKAKKDQKTVCTQEACEPQFSYDLITNKSQAKMTKNFEQPQVDRLLLPQGETGKSRANDRKKHPRLAGADLYVTRLGWNNNNIAKPNPKNKVVKSSARNEVPPSSSESDLEPPPLLSSSSSTCTLGNTGSLYDELGCHAPSTPPAVSECAPSIPREAIHASRPCYRCVSYMHSVGIKRVFWTNDDGEWEGGKVAKFIDALDGEGDGAGCGGGPVGNGVFVTKHEVLMMRRMMGD